ncbi:MAG: hypothetical protein KJS97_00925 [Alphaproteobacteria bacterium]|nr:hypothetical protein [Alphaproteobacteria bacterium]
MDVADGALWLLRAIGALWLVGGLFLIRQLLTFGPLERALDQLSPDAAESADRGRDAWMLAGGVTTALAGALLLAGTRWALLGLCAVIVHQMAYFVRQRRRELAAKTEDGAEDARPARATINAFFFSLCVAVLTSWVVSQGAMW